jgi:hypothetical protein
LVKRCQAGLPFRIIRGQRDEDADPFHPLALLRGSAGDVGGRERRRRS